MTSITITFIVFAAAILLYRSLSLFLIYEKRKKEKLFRHLSNEGAANNLTFCSQELLEDKVIGFDGIHRKIMIVAKENKTYCCSLISLDEVHHCRLVTDKGVVDPAEFKKETIPVKPCKLALRFEFNNQPEAASIVFAEGYKKSQREFAVLRAKAEFWCRMFSKMLQNQMVARA